jgi:hypothetical protein
LTSRAALANALLNQGRAAEAEPLLDALLPAMRRAKGANDKVTLAARHALGVAYLFQRKFPEAETAFRDAMTISERMAGRNYWHSKIYRYWLALATVEQGDGADAAALLKSLPKDLGGDPEFEQRHYAMVAYVRGRTADVLGDKAEGARQLALSRSIYASIWPDDHYYRRVLEDYIARRGGIADA